MSLIFTDSFDTGNAHTDKWTENFNGDFGFGAGRTGPSAASATSGATNKYLRLALSSTEEHDEIIVGYAYNPGATATECEPLYFLGDNSSITHVRLQRTLDNSYQILTPAGTVGPSLNDTFSLNTYHYVEMKVKCSNTAGEVQLRVNGQIVLQAFATDTNNGAPDNIIDGIRIDNSLSGADVLFDDLYILNTKGARNNEYLGDVTIHALFPNANGTYSQLVGSDGDSVDNYQLVDENPADTADYVFSAVDGEKDTYNYQNLSVAGSVKGVVVNSYALSGDASLAGFRTVVRSESVDNTNADPHTLSQTPTLYRDYYEQNPSTSVEWTVADIAAAEFGFEVEDSP